MKKILLIVFIASASYVHAQDETVKKLRADATRAIKKDEKDTVNKVWKKGGLFSLNLAQASLTNWAAGGEDYSLSINALFSTYLFYKKGLNSWDNTLDFNLGYLNTTSLGSRKNDDRLDFLSKFGHQIARNLNLAALFNFRTQLFKGYTYTDTGRILSSSFMSPAYILLGIGLDYKPNDRFSIYFSPATIRWIIVKNDSLAAKGLYGVDPGKHTKMEFGAFASISYVNEFNKIFAYKGRLDLFSNYNHKPQNVDVYMTNILTVKLSKVLSASWNVDLIYDDDTKLFGKNHNSPALQVKSLVGIGVLFHF
jgi:hypothetical protein